MTHEEAREEAEEIMDRQQRAKADKPKAPPESEVEEVRIYVVQRGDSLSKIAQEVYGDSSRWREIFDANREQIKDPKLIRPGQELRIP
jgi:nucleoid-associated protein YgaU